MRSDLGMELGLRRFFALVPFTKVPFWYHFFELQLLWLSRLFSFKLGSSSGVRKVRSWLVVSPLTCQGVTLRLVALNRHEDGEDVTVMDPVSLQQPQTGFLRA